MKAVKEYDSKKTEECVHFILTKLYQKMVNRAYHGKFQFKYNFQFILDNSIFIFRHLQRAIHLAIKHVKQFGWGSKRVHDKMYEFHYIGAEEGGEKEE